MRQLVGAAAVAAIAGALWTPTPSAAAGHPAAHVSHARLGPMAEAAIAATAHGQHLPANWVVGRASRKGTTYGIFLRGSTTAKAIAATGAIPGTVLSVGATAQATLPELNALAAIPGITEVELAGKTTKQLDQSVPAIHASEPSHASAAGIPHLWSGTGGSTKPKRAGGRSSGGRRRPATATGLPVHRRSSVGTFTLKIARA